MILKNGIKNRKNIDKEFKNNKDWRIFNGPKYV